MPDSSIQPSDDQLFAELRKIDTPTITNVVATYPKNPLCLGLYNPWTENWYTDTSIRCIYPEMGAIVGYAVTCVYGLPDPNYAGRLSFMDVVDALDAMKKPTILVIQQKWPPELHNKAGLAGEMMVSSMMAVGCVGMLSNGPSRDVDAIRKLRFQLLLGGVTAGHGEMAVQSVNVPVSVGGMDVAPGDLIHMDENGAVKFPPKHAPAIVKNAQAMLEDEARRLVLLRKAKTAAEVRAASSAAPTRRRRRSSGAIFINSDVIITNNHVVDGCVEVRARKSGADIASVRVVASNRGDDLAALRSERPSDQHLKLRIGTPIRPAESVLVFGYPLAGALSSMGNRPLAMLLRWPDCGMILAISRFLLPSSPATAGAPCWMRQVDSLASSRAS